MQRLINDLLAFSRIGRSTFSFEPVDLPQVQSDAALLRQLLLNLFGNGMKFRRDGVPPVVRIDARRFGAHWQLAVADEGLDELVQAHSSLEDAQSGAAARNQASSPSTPRRSSSSSSGCTAAR